MSRWGVLVCLVLAACDGRTDAAGVSESAVAPSPPPVVVPDDSVSEIPEPTEPAPVVEVRAPMAPPSQIAAYTVRRPKSVVDLQQFRAAVSARIEDQAGLQGVATLTDLNPSVQDWLLLELAWPGRGTEVYHLENPDPARRHLRLDPRYLFGLVLDTPYGEERCDLWSLGERSPLALARQGRQPYAELCRSRLYLRNPIAGRKTTLEWATDFLRDRVVGGEKITVFVRDTLLKDAHLSTSEILDTDPALLGRPRLPAAPAPPAIDAAYKGRSIVPDGLGLVLETPNRNEIQVGRWHAIRGVPHVFLSAFQSRLIDGALRAQFARRLNPLDEVESSALVYLVAFDLAEHQLGFGLGTEHPRLEWSDRVPESVRLAGLPGPDGVADVSPLVRTGMVNPDVSSRVVGTFTGGFKRTHGAFKYGEPSLRNGGTHYGFVEHGTVFSKLQPGLATVVVYNDDTVALKTWTEADDADLWRVRHARQNGLPLVEPDPTTGQPRPGAMVPNWSQGNWSGSQEQRLRTLRAGACIQESDAGRFLIYGYFSGATPSGMASVFLAYGCSYALMLDINALEHTYLALYRVLGGQFLTQHLIDEMSVLDRSDSGQELPRFVGFADNRDYFYMTRKRSR